MGILSFPGRVSPVPAIPKPAAEVATASSEDFFDPVNRPVGGDLARPHGEQPVQGGISGVSRLKPWQRPKIGTARRLVIADALERHVNEGAVVDLQRYAQVELENAVCAFD